DAICAQGSPLYSSDQHQVQRIDDQPSLAEASEVQVFDEWLRAHHHRRDVPEDIQYRHVLSRVKPGALAARCGRDEPIRRTLVQHEGPLSRILRGTICDGLSE